MYLGIVFKLIFFVVRVIYIGIVGIKVDGLFFNFKNFVECILFSFGNFFYMEGGFCGKGVSGKLVVKVFDN